MNLKIELPDEIAQLFEDQGVDLRREALEFWAVLGYQRGVLTSFEVQKMLGLGSRWETEAFLQRVGADGGYTVEDLLSDQQTLAKLMGNAEPM